MKRGDTYRFTSGSDLHLYIVVSDPPKDSELIVVVNITSYKYGLDSTCLLSKGDHWKITHDSIVYYKMAYLEDSRHLDKCVTKGSIKKEGRMKPALMDRITAGFKTSPDATQECIDKLKDLGLI